MKPYINDDNAISCNKKKRLRNPDKLNRDLRRWQRKNATIEKYMQEKLGQSSIDRCTERGPIDQSDR